MNVNRSNNTIKFRKVVSKLSVKYPLVVICRPQIIWKNLQQSEYNAIFDGTLLINSLNESVNGN